MDFFYLQTLHISFPEKGAIQWFIRWFYVRDGCETLAGFVFSLNENIPPFIIGF